MRKVLSIIVALAFLLTGAVWVPARPAAKALHGRVVDSHNQAVPAARIFMQSADGSSPHAFSADKEGRFSRVLQRTGLYDVRAQSGGSWSEWQRNVSLKSSAQSELVLRLVRTTPPEAPR